MNNHSEDQGFTLIELLVVVIIVGILAAIAIPSFLNQRQGAYRAQMSSDLRNAAVRMDQEFHMNGGTYTADALTDFRATSGVLTVTEIRPDGNSYCLTASVTGWGFRTYDSALGGVQPLGTPC